MRKEKKDCIFYKKDTRKAGCSALKELYCKDSGVCRFYKRVPIEKENKTPVT